MRCNKLSRLSLLLCVCLGSGQSHFAKKKWIQTAGSWTPGAGMPVRLRWSPASGKVFQQYTSRMKLCPRSGFCPSPESTDAITQWEWWLFFLWLFLFSLFLILSFVLIALGALIPLLCLLLKIFAVLIVFLFLQISSLWANSFTPFVFCFH